MRVDPVSVIRSISFEIVGCKESVKVERLY